MATSSTHVWQLQPAAVPFMDARGHCPHIFELDEQVTEDIAGVTTATYKTFQHYLPLACTLLVLLLLLLLLVLLLLSPPPSAVALQDQHAPPSPSVTRVFQLACTVPINCVLMSLQSGVVGTREVERGELLL